MNNAVSGSDDGTDSEAAWGYAYSRKNPLRLAHQPGASVLSTRPSLDCLGCSIAWCISILIHLWIYNPT